MLNMEDSYDRNGCGFSWVAFPRISNFASNITYST